MSNRLCLIYPHGFNLIWILTLHFKLVIGGSPSHHEMESFVIPLVLTGIIFIILIGLLFYWLYKDNRHKVLGCVPCRKFFMKHKHLDDTGVFQKPLMYNRKSLELATIEGQNGLHCPCQRFRHITGEQADIATQMHDISLDDQNMTLTSKSQGHELLTNDVTNCDIIIDDCDRCHGCKCTPVSMYKTLDRSTSSDSTEREVALNLTPEITFVMVNGCRCGCQGNQQTPV